MERAPEHSRRGVRALAALWLRRVVLGWFLPPYMVQMENDVYTRLV